MKRRLLLTLSLLLFSAAGFEAWAYDFSAVAPTGQTLYYEILTNNGVATNNVSVVAPNTPGSWDGFSKPTGALTIPPTVVSNGTSYVVTSIGNRAFGSDDSVFSCNELTSIIIPNSVHYISHYAFRYCVSLASVEMPNSVIYLGEGAFDCCTDLTYISLSTSLLDIKEYTFYYCVSLGAVEIPNSVTTIDGYAFAGCRSLTSVTIPDSVISIGYASFYNCRELVSVTIPNSVNRIGAWAFENCMRLSSIAIPSSVTTIGDGAFYNCKALASVTMPNSVTSIANYTFKGCGRLSSVTIPNTVSSIGSEAFYNCRNLAVTVPNTVTSIGSSAFFGCVNVLYQGRATGSPWGARAVNGWEDGYLIYQDSTRTKILSCITSAPSVTIPSSVKIINSDAFDSCSILTSVIFNANNCSSMSYSDWGDYSVFSKCRNLDTLTIGVNVKTLPTNAFAHCGHLSTIVFNADSCVSMGGVFSNCSNIVTLSIANNVKSIPASAFTGLSRIRSVTIPQRIKTIGESAFNNCSNLTTLYFNADSCTYMGSSSSLAFGGCNQLRNVIFGNNVKYIPSYAFYGRSVLDSVIIGDSVANIASRAFKNCSGLTTLTLGSSVATIGSEAFDGCTHLSYVNYLGSIEDWCKINFSTIQSNPVWYAHHLYINGVELTSLTIPNSISAIGWFSFSGCNSLTSVTIPSTVGCIYDAAFRECRGLLTVFFNSDSCIVGGWEDNTRPFYHSGNQCTLTIGNNVKTLNSSMFKCFDGMSTVIFGDSLRVIGSDAFSWCNGLTLVNYSGAVQDWLSINFGNIDANPLWHAHHLNINGTEVTSLAIPNGFTNIKQFTLAGCRGLTDLTIPNGVYTIENNAFEGCSSITGLTIPNNVTSIGGSAFKNCTAITSLIFPNTLTTISNEAFAGCTGITELTIPSSVTTIGSNAFANCSGLNSVYMKSEIRPSSSGNIPTSAVIYVPCGSTISYQSLWGTNYYFVEYYSRDFQVHSANEQQGTAVIIQQPTCTNVVSMIYANANNGYHFSQWQDGNTDNPRTVYVVSDCSYTASFEANVTTSNYYVQVSSANAAMGSAVGSGLYEEQTPITIAAVPSVGYQFSHWNDNDQSNPRQIVLSYDTAFVAHFELLLPDTVSVHDTTLVDNYIHDTTILTQFVHDTTTLWQFDTTYIDHYIHDTTILTEYVHHTTIVWQFDTTVVEHYVFDTTYITLMDTLLVTQIDTLIVRDTIVEPVAYYDLTVLANNPTVGLAAGNGRFPAGSEVDIAARPLTGGHFLQWDDGNSDNPLTRVLAGNDTYTALFETN